MRVIDFGQEECKKAADLLDAFLKNELSAETSQRIAEHVDKCETCSQEAKYRSELQERVQKALRQEMPDAGVEARLKARLRRKASNEYLLHWAAPLAAAAALVIGSFAVWQKMQPEQERWMTSTEDQRAYLESLYGQVANVIQIGLRDHVHCAYFRKFAETLPTMDEIVALVGGDYEELAPVVRDSVPEGFHILLGHQCGYAGRHYIHFALGREDDLMSVIITRKEGDESFDKDQLLPVLEAAGSPVYAATADQFETAAFDTENYFVFVISNLPREENLEVAGALTPRIRAFLDRASS